MTGTPEQHLVLDLIAQRATAEAQLRQATRPVVAYIPAEVNEGIDGRRSSCLPLEVLFRHNEDGTVVVDIRHDSLDAWTPLELLGGQIEVRER